MKVELANGYAAQMAAWVQERLQAGATMRVHYEDRDGGVAVVSVGSDAAAARSWLQALVELYERGNG